MNPWSVEEVFFDSFMAVLSVLLLYMTANGINSACMVLLWVVLPYFMRGRIAKHAGIKFKGQYGFRFCKRFIFRL